MKLGSARLLFVAPLVAAAVLVSSSCGDHAPAGPTPAPDASLLPINISIGSLNVPIGIIADCVSLTSATTVKTIGSGGGKIAVGPDTLWIPPGALSQPVTIQATIPAGAYGNYVQFKPDGLIFARPALLTIGYGNCSLLYALPLKIAQVTSALQIITYVPSADFTIGRTVTGSLRHFSNYAVAW
jgi:hypothetical protein